jgi:hypothetical protein
VHRQDPKRGEPTLHVSAKRHPLGGPFSIAHGINGRSDVGETWIDENDASHALLWQANILPDLGTPDGD